MYYEKKVLGVFLVGTLCKSPGKAFINYIAVSLAITALRTLHAVPKKHFYCSTLVTTDTLEVFFF